MKLSDIHTLHFDTLNQAQDFAGDSHKYRYECSGCGDVHTCRCGQHKEKIIIKSCPNCEDTSAGCDAMNMVGFAPADKGIPKDIGNRLPTGGRMDNTRPATSRASKFQGSRIPPMY